MLISILLRTVREWRRLPIGRTRSQPCGDVTLRLELDLTGAAAGDVRVDLGAHGGVERVHVVSAPGEKRSKLLAIH